MLNYLQVKRIFDFVIASFALFFFSPVLILIAVLLFLFNHQKVLFIQSRPGRNEKIFQLFKFQTMNEEKDERGNLLSDETRITKIGSVLRRASLDELPQLINVIKGDMSLVGPRPLLISYLPLYNENQRKRHILRPGITGWAQVNGRNKLNWNDRFEMDLWYTQNISAKLDLKIILMTISKVLIGDGVSCGESATMKPFKGN